MARYLTPYFAEQALRRGKSIEQLLDKFEFEGHPAIRWLTIYCDHEKIALEVHETFDEGSENFLDVTEFTAIGSNPARVHSFDEIDQAIKYASITYGAREDRYVNEGVIGDEYADNNFINDGR